MNVKDGMLLLLRHCVPVSRCGSRHRKASLVDSHCLQYRTDQTSAFQGHHLALSRNNRPLQTSETPVTGRRTDSNWPSGIHSRLPAERRRRAGSQPAETTRRQRSLQNRDNASTSGSSRHRQLRQPPVAASMADRRALHLAVEL